MIDKLYSYHASKTFGWISEVFCSLVKFRTAFTVFKLREFIVKSFRPQRNFFSCFWQGKELTFFG